MEDLKKLLGEKKKLAPTEKDAKIRALQDMKKMAGDALVGDMKKVTVAADSNKNLEKGLDKAKEVLHEMPEHPEHELAGEEDSEEEEALESPMEEKAEMLADCDTPEKIDAMMKMLMEKKAQLEKA